MRESKAHKERRRHLLAWLYKHPMGQTIEEIAESAYYFDPRDGNHPLYTGRASYQRCRNDLKILERKGKAVEVRDRRYKPTRWKPEPSPQLPRIPAEPELTEVVLENGRQSVGYP